MFVIMLKWNGNLIWPH